MRGAGSRTPGISRRWCCPCVTHSKVANVYLAASAFQAYWQYIEDINKDVELSKYTDLLHEYMLEEERAEGTSEASASISPRAPSVPPPPPKPPSPPAARVAATTKRSKPWESEEPQAYVKRLRVHQVFTNECELSHGLGCVLPNDINEHGWTNMRLSRAIIEGLDK